MIPLEKDSTGLPMDIYVHSSTGRSREAHQGPAFRVSQFHNMENLLQHVPRYGTEDRVASEESNVELALGFGDINHYKLS